MLPTLYEQSLEFRRELNDRPQIAHLLNKLGILKGLMVTMPGRELYEESLAIRRELGDKKWIAQSLTISQCGPGSEQSDRSTFHLEEALVMLRKSATRGDSERA